MNVLLVDEYAPHPKFFCKTTHMGNVTELTAMQKRSYGAPTVRIDKDHYKDLRSGCIHEYAHGETRADNADSVRRTLATVRAHKLQCDGAAKLSLAYVHIRREYDGRKTAFC